MPRVEFTTLAFLTDMERNVIFPALSELHLTFQGDFEKPHILKKYFVERFGNVKFDLRSYTNIKKLTWFPLNRECQIFLASVVIENDSGMPLANKVSGNYDDYSNGVATFSYRYPSMSFDIDNNTRLTQFNASFDFIYIGHEVPGMAQSVLRAERDKQIELHAERLRERDQQIELHAERLRERDQEIELHAERLREREQQLALHAQWLSERDQQIQLLLNTISWKITKPLRYISRKIRAAKTKYANR
jgi:hypothetical protein